MSTIGESIEISIEEVSGIEPRCGEEIGSKVDKAFKGVGRGKYGRAIRQSPKKGRRGAERWREVTDSALV